MLVYTQVKIEIAKVTTFVTKLIDLCTQHNIILLTSRLKIERSMVNISMEWYDQICELLRSKQTIANLASVSNSLLHFWKMEHKKTTR
jgi:hypothetical protein